MMRTMVAAAALALGGAVLAQDGAGKGREGEAGKVSAKASLRFSQVDANGDGKLTKVEWLGFFAKLDANKDGVISAEEAGEGSVPVPGKGREGAGRKGGEGDRGEGKGGKGDGK